MATRSSDAYTECSICLEPYRGPALLSCRHTVCSPCLASLLSLQGDEFQRATYRVDDKKIEDIVTTVSCPICRNVSTISSPGFTDLQRNVCEKMSTVTCDLCEDDREAIVHCSQCRENICQQCRPFHARYNKSHSVTSLSEQPNLKDEVQDRAEKQASIVTAMLARLEEEERQLQQQGVALEDDINARCSVGLLEMVKARDKCLSDLKVIVQGHQLRLLEEKTILGARYENLQRIVSSARDSSVPLQTLQAGLLEDEAVHDFKKRLGSATHTQYVVYTKNEDISPHNIVQDFMGSVVSSQNDNSTKNTCSLDGAVGHDESCSSEVTEKCHPLSAEGAITDSRKNANMDNKVGTLINNVDSLIAQMDDMKNENKDLQSKLLSLQDLLFQQNTDYRAVRDKHTNLQQEVTSVKEVNFALHHDVSSLQEQILELFNNRKIQEEQFSELHEDCAMSQAKLMVMEQEVRELFQSKTQTMALSQLEKDVKLSKEGLNTLQNELSALKSSQGQISALQRSTTLIKNEQASLAGTLQRLTTQINKAGTVVAFHALVDKKFTLSSEQVIIADHVITNHGAAYDNTTGMFTAPVTGIYTFLATACSTEGTAIVDVIIDGVGRVAHIRAAADSRATGHAIVELNSGQKVCMKTFSSECSTFEPGWRTSFSGSLLKAN